MVWRCAAILSVFFPVLAQLPTLEWSQLKPDAVIPVELAAGAVPSPEGIFIPAPQTRAIVPVRAGNNSAGTPIPIGQAPCGPIAIAFDALWTGVCDGTGVVRIDVAHNVSATVPLAPSEPSGGLAVAAGSIWLATDVKGVVSRLDPATNDAVAEVYVAPKPFAVVADQDAVWVTSEAGDVLTRIDAHTNVTIERIKVGPRPGPLAIGDGSVWTLNRGDGSVSRVDLKSNKVVNTITVDESIAAGTIAAGEGAVWISAPGVPLVRIDPRTNRVTHKFTGAGGGALVVGHGSLWVNAGPGVTWRVDPKLVAALRPD